MNIPCVTLNNGMSLPQMGIGLWKMSDTQAERSVRAALDRGYRLIDTATIYGNEAGVGRAIAASGIPRSEVFVTTKLWNSNHDYAAAIRACEQSLRALKLDYIDLYLIHWPVPAGHRFIEAWRALELLYREGKVGAIGVSNFQPHHLQELMAVTSVVPAVNQVELHPRFSQRDMRAFCGARGIRVESWSPLGGSRGVRTLLGEPTLTAIGAARGKTPAQVVLRWHVQLGLIVIPKSARAGRISENSDIFDFTLNEEEMSQISALDNGQRQGPDPETMNLRVSSRLVRLAHRLNMVK